MKNNQELIRLYNELDALLRERYREKSRSTSVITRFITDLNRSSNDYYNDMAKKLNMIRIIRNDMIHELDMNSENLISITDDTIKFLSDLVNQIKNPRTAENIYTPIKDIFFIKYRSKYDVFKLMSDMRRKGFSQVPLLNERNVVLGVFSPNALFDYLVNNNQRCVTSLSLDDMAEYLQLEKHFSESYRFVSIDTSEEVLNDIFIESFKKNKKLAMIFVTKNGSSTEPLLGIIVNKDLRLN